MDNNTTLMGCIIALLMFNLFIVLYNESPIENKYTGSNFSIDSVATELNESGITDSSTGLNVFLVFGRFLINIFTMMFWWYPSFSFIVNTIIKLATYIFVLPIIIIAYDKLRGI